MHRKPIMRNLLVASLVFLLVIAGITVFVLAAPGDSEATLATTPPADEVSSPAPAATLALESVESPAADIQFLYTEEAVPYQTIHVEDNSIPKGTEVRKNEGENGLIRHTEELMLHDGKVVARQDGGVTVLKEVVNEIILDGTYVEPPKAFVYPAKPATYTPKHPDAVPELSENAVTTYATAAGTGSYDKDLNMLSSVTIDKENKTITTPSGEVYSYSKCVLGEATGYSCEGQSNPITATGTSARVGEVAVDPKFIPLGTKLFIMLSDGSLIYGLCAAEDTGGAVKGNVIDLYMNTFADCSLIGRSPCDVYILY